MKLLAKVGCAPIVGFALLLVAIRTIGPAVNTAIGWVEQHAMFLWVAFAIVAVLWLLRRLARAGNP